MFAFKVDQTQGVPGGLICPVLLCDHCGKQIEHTGNMLYIMPEELPSSDIFYFRPDALHHVHKHCNREFEKRQPEKRFYWDTINDWLVQTLTNTELVSDKTARKLLDESDKAAKKYWEWRKQFERDDD